MCCMNGLILKYRVQVKCFTQDLLKSQARSCPEQVLTDLLLVFLQGLEYEYGMCELTDIISEIPDTTICLSQQDNETVICIAKRECTEDEIERTKKFSKDVVNLLCTSHNSGSPLTNSSSPTTTYNGFTKLLELFETIPVILQVLECGEKKILAQMVIECFKVLTAQLSNSFLIEKQLPDDD